MEENTIISPFTPEYFMRQAILEAKKAEAENEVPIGTVIVIDNKIIARGYNQVEKLNDCTAHAEIIALTSAFQYLNSKYVPNASLFVTLEPCLMCCGALYWSKISKIYFGASDEKNGYKKHCSSNPFHPKTEIHSGLLAEESLTLIQDFFKKKR